MPNHTPHELIDIYQDECAKLRAELYKTIHELGEVRANAGLVVHAFDCALALNEQLFIFLPEGTSLPPAVATCKHNLDTAMAKLNMAKLNMAKLNMAKLNMAKLKAAPEPSPAPPAPSEEMGHDAEINATIDQEPDKENESMQNERLRKALVVAAANIASLNEQLHEMIRAMNSAIQLVDGLVGEMSTKGVRPTPVLIALHNQFTREMDKVFKGAGVQKHPQRTLIS